MAESLLGKSIPGDGTRRSSPPRASCRGRRCFAVQIVEQLVESSLQLLGGSRERLLRSLVVWPPPETHATDDDEPRRCRTTCYAIVADGHIMCITDRRHLGVVWSVSMPD